MVIYLHRHVTVKPSKTKHCVNREPLNLPATHNMETRKVYGNTSDVCVYVYIYLIYISYTC